MLPTMIIVMGLALWFFMIFLMVFSPSSYMLTTLKHDARFLLGDTKMYSCDKCKKGDWTFVEARVIKLEPPLLEGFTYKHPVEYKRQRCTHCKDVRDIKVGLSANWLKDSNQCYICSSENTMDTEWTSKKWGHIVHTRHCVDGNHKYAYILEDEADGEKSNDN